MRRQQRPGVYLQGVPSGRLHCGVTAVEPFSQVFHGAEMVLEVVFFSNFLEPLRSRGQPARLVGEPTVRIRKFRARWAHSAMFIPRKPPILTSPSFFAPIVHVLLPVCQDGTGKVSTESLDDLIERPHMISNPRLHGWRNTDSRMNAGEVVVHQVERQRMPVIFDLLGMGIG